MEYLQVSKPISQSRNASGREYTYDILEPWGGTPGERSAQQQTLDSSHPGQPHWEAGKVRVDADGNVKTNSYGRPRLNNEKSIINGDKRAKKKKTIWTTKGGCLFK